ncbi:MAG: plasmid stabilization protein [Kineosporiaceae bacterium]
MATLTVRGFDDELHAKLRVRAARHGRSMEAEVRSILEAELEERIDAAGGLGSRIHARFVGAGGADLVVPDRRDEARAADVA